MTGVATAARKKPAPETATAVPKPRSPALVSWESLKVLRNNSRTMMVVSP